jgi:lipopolysaccharide transport system ATP-binding protein
MPPAIRIENLSKSYRIQHGSARGGYRTLRDSLSAAATWPLRKLQGQVNGSVEEFWALKEVNLEIAEGDVVGIIGRNGAGKSTLLKVLSRITAPTAGRVELRGRVASLLEVGTGFHQELTGRENVFLNGSILGMSRREIQRKFDEIVDFAGVEKFLDTPVKRYSSGMYVRLAFAVAANLEPEILIIDEVLAVGDSEFQNKCIGKMGEVARSGRTVIFVSHNMAAVESLCKECALLVDGAIISSGKMTDVIEHYLGTYMPMEQNGTCLISHSGRSGQMTPVMRRAYLTDDSGERTNVVPMGLGISIHVEFGHVSRIDSPILGVVIKTLRGGHIFGVNNRFIPGYSFSHHVGKGTLTCHFSSLPLMPGSYLVDLWFGDSLRDIDQVNDAIQFEVLPRDVFGSGKMPPGGCGPFFWNAEFSICDAV